VIDRPELLAIHTKGRGTTYNAVFRSRASAETAETLVDEIREFHGDCPSRWLLYGHPEDEPLKKALLRGGYQRGHVHDARVVAVDQFRPRASSGFRVAEVSDEKTHDDGNRVSDAAFDRTPRPSDKRELAMFTDASIRTRFFVVYDDEDAVAAGGLNLYPDTGIGFLWGGGTIPDARGRGAYSALVAHRIAFADSQGLRLVGLYARVESSSPIVAAQGFERCGTMTQWERSATESR